MDFKFKIKDKVYFYNKYCNEIYFGEIIDLRESKYNWDYKIRYLIRADTNFSYDIWIESNYINDKKENLFRFLY